MTRVRYFKDDQEVRAAGAFRDLDVFEGQTTSYIGRLTLEDFRSDSGLGADADVVSAKLVPGSFRFIEDPVPIPIDSEIQEGFTPTIDYQIAIEGNDITFNVTGEDDIYIGFYTAFFSFEADVEVTAFVTREDENGNKTRQLETFIQTGGVSDHVIAWFNDNDRWGTQELEDAHTARLNQFLELGVIRQLFADRLQPLFDQFQENAEAVDAAALAFAKNAVGLAYDVYTRHPRASEGFKDFATLVGLGLNADAFSNAKTANEKIDALTNASITILRETAKNKDLPDSLTRLANELGLYATLYNAIETAESFFELRDAAQASEQARQWLREAVADDILRNLELNELQKSFAIFIRYYNEGVRRGEHRPDEFREQLSEADSKALQESLKKAQDALQRGGTSGDDLNFASESDEIFLVSSGDDQVRGASSDLNGDQLIGFGPGDSITLIDVELGAEAVSLKQGSTIIEIDANSDGYHETVISLVGEDTPDTLFLSTVLGQTTLSADGVGEAISFLSPTGGPNVIDGTQGADLIRGLGGNDTIDGLQDDDVIFGGRGDDKIVGGSGEDSLRGNAGDDTLRGGGGDDNLKGNGGNDVIRAGGGSDIVKGGGGSDLIFGGGGGDRLNGGGGADTLRGNGGDDTLKGNGGADVFQFRASDRNDTILDFRQGQDKIQIQSGATSFEALRIEQDGLDVLIGFGAGQVRIVTDQVNAFSEDDFIL